MVNIDPGLVIVRGSYPTATGPDLFRDDSQSIPDWLKVNGLQDQRYQAVAQIAISGRGALLPFLEDIRKLAEDPDRSHWEYWRLADDRETLVNVTSPKFIVPSLQAKDARAGEVVKPDLRRRSRLFVGLADERSDMTLVTIEKLGTKLDSPGAIYSGPTFSWRPGKSHLPGINIRDVPRKGLTTELDSRSPIEPENIRSYFTKATKDLVAAHAALVLGDRSFQ